jgi:5-methylcytosine-specific restriction endonuclease McrA
MGDRPGDPVRSEARRHILYFDVSAATFATFREAVAHLRRRSEQPLDDDALLLLMAREILQGPSDHGRASYQLAMTTCEHCAQGFQNGAGEVLPVEPEIVEMAKCDAQELGNVSVPHVGAHATQAIPPALRRRVLRRDHGHCVVPGCCHGTFLDVHHLMARSEGGAHKFDNLVTLCAAHHRALHFGQLTIEGTPSSGLVFRHTDGSTYGGAPDVARVDAIQKVFLALTGQGFSEKQARAALVHASNRSGPKTSKQLLRASLLWLTRKSLRRE